MGFYLVVAVASLVLLPVAYRRSGSMTRYVTVTGAPVVWGLLLLSSVLSMLAHQAGPDTGRAAFTGGLIGTAFAQVVLLRHGARQDEAAHHPEQPTDDPPAR